MNKNLVFTEKLFAVLSLLHYTSGPLPVILAGGQSEGDVGTRPDNGLIWILFMLTYGVSLFLLVARWKKTIYLFRKDKFIWVLIAVAVLSILWSFAPGMTFRRCIALVGSTAFGFYLATRYSLKELLQLLTWMFVIAVVLSFIFAVALPKFGIMGGVHSGAWRGIYYHKNTLGRTIVVGNIVFLLMAMDDKKHRLWLWCGFIFSSVLLVQAKSTTSLVNLVSILFLIPIYRMFRWRYDVMVPSIIVVITLAGGFSLLLQNNSTALLNSIGKDATLTGRTDLWPAVLDKISRNPWLGYGYSGFWSTDWSGESAYVWYATGWTPPNSHNGFLDLWLDLGLLGMSVFVAGFCNSIVRGLVWLRVSKTFANLFPLIYLTYLVLANFTENSLLVQNDIFWVLYVAVSLSILLPPEKMNQKYP